MLSMHEEERIMVYSISSPASPLMIRSYCPEP